MVSLIDVLLAMSNIPVNDPIAEIWGRGLQGGGYTVIEYTGTLPITITADGNALLDYRIYGNTVQSGTPTPEAPVDVVGCGVRTGNLFDKSNHDSRTNVTLNAQGQIMEQTSDNSWTISDYISISSEIPTYTASGLARGGSGTYCCVYDSQKNFLRSIPIYANQNVTINTQNGDAFVRLSIRMINNEIETAMFNSGSTAPTSYIPYGYKLPMVSRTENLFDADIQQGSFAGATGEETNATTRIRSTSINVTSGTYTISLETDDLVVIYVYDSDGNYIRQESVIVWVTQPYTFNIIGDRKIRFAFRHTNDSSNISPGDITQFMLNEGSTPLPYEPYGYTVTNIYLGEAETTRKIKKLVLTGEETSYMAIDASKNIFSIRGAFNQAPELLQVGGFCTHYKYNNTISSLAQNMSNGDFALNKIVDDYSFTIRDNSFSDDTDFKQYVQQQYAAGTPVTVWYVLAEPETGIVNEPLMKIGDFADTVSMEQAGVSIPTVAGATVIDCDWTPKPSRTYIKYRR